MKVLRLVISIVLVSVIFTQCKKDNLMDDLSNNDLTTKEANTNTPAGTYTVTVENVSTPYDYFASGVQAIPEGKDAAGPALPGDTYKFSFHAGPNHKLSFATMYGWSNDGFFAPGDDGISLYDGNIPKTGDITSMIMLWDAGTEMNQEPGMNNMHDGANVPDGMVQLMSAVGDGFDYGTVDEHLMVTLNYDGNSMFTVTVENLNGAIKTPISPIVWVIHKAGQKPIFTEEQMDYGNGLEDVAETGNPGPLSSYLKMNSGYVSPVAPFLWVLHDKKDMPIFTEGEQASAGLQTLAETGLPFDLSDELMPDYVTGVQAIPEGDNTPGPIFPGEMYKFTIDGYVGQSISFASMLGASNDIFFSTGDKGIKLSNGDSEVDITHLFELYDSGTEVNEYPGAGIYQGPPEGPDENGVVHLEDDGLPWPDVSQVIKVTIKKN